MRSRAGYERLRTQDDDVASKYKRDDSRFETLKAEIPWASIVLAVCLVVFGITSFVFAWLHFTQAILGKTQAEIGFTFLGLVTFIPGAYHCLLAYGAWCGWRGYTFDSIPNF